MCVHFPTLDAWVMQWGDFSNTDDFIAPVLKKSSVKRNNPFQVTSYFGGVISWSHWRIYILTTERLGTSPAQLCVGGRQHTVWGHAFSQTEEIIEGNNEMHNIIWCPSFSFPTAGTDKRICSPPVFNTLQCLKAGSCIIFTQKITA